MPHALEVKPQGGAACFANAVAADEALPAEVKRRVEGKYMVHAYDLTRHYEPRLPP
jgi:alpha-ketoglutarate-dependent taurine dioxygenase